MFTILNDATQALQSVLYVACNSALTAIHGMSLGALALLDEVPDEFRYILSFVLFLYVTMFVCFNIFSSFVFVYYTLLEPLLSMAYYAVSVPLRVGYYFLVWLFKSDSHEVSVLLFKDYKFVKDFKYKMRNKRTLDDLAVHCPALLLGNIYIDNKDVPLSYPIEHDVTVKLVINSHSKR